MENLPQGPGLIVYYHGAVVFDYILFIAKVYAKTGRTICSVVHCFFYLVPGEVFKITGGSLLVTTIRTSNLVINKEVAK